ncbi:MAG: hypothetical protein RJP95_02025 [Pirellulales bacterium]
MGSGFWISPTNVPIPITEHEDAVRATPERFGLTRESLPPRKAHDSRQKVLLAAMRMGWVRVRQYVGNGEYWVVEFVEQRRPLQSWLADFCEAGKKMEIHRYSEVRVHAMTDDGQLEHAPLSASFEQLIRSSGSISDLS